MSASHWPIIARELVVTTLGVLVALALNSWWGERQDRSREHTYIVQLVADIDRSLAPANLPAAVVQEDAATRATMALVRAYRMASPPSSDSIARWLFGTQKFASFTPPTGTARALLSTRDISLIRNDSVRTLIVAMVTALDDDAIKKHDYEVRWRDQVGELERYSDFIALTEQISREGRDTSTGAAGADVQDPFAILPASPRREPFRPTDYKSLLRNRDAYRALVKLSTIHRNTLAILQGELSGLRQLRPVFARGESAR